MRSPLEKCPDVCKIRQNEDDRLLYVPCEQSIKNPAREDHLISPEKPSRTVHGTYTCSQTEYTHISAHVSIKKSLHNIRCTLVLQGQCIVFSEPVEEIKGPENYHHNVVV